MKLLKLLKNKTVFKIPLITIVVVVAILTSGLIAWGVLVTDTFTTTGQVADTWRTTVSTSTGKVILATKTCDPTDWYCSDFSCTNNLGDGDYIIVAKVDVSGTKQWKTVNTTCDIPECGQDGGQDGDNMVADNTVTFGSTYPAREACKAIGGRLPTKTELNCIYTNKTTFGDNFQSLYYWSSTEYSTDNAWAQIFSTGSQANTSKTYNLYVRCVLGW